ncbi:hypothetical protein EVA_11703 [gut metagenome]|uniref:Uncharacterized protein n=1 Tax=gut metagenome TaxID=749906 RepID=J9GKJ2_9ZZZZ
MATMPPWSNTSTSLRIARLSPTTSPTPRSRAWTWSSSPMPPIASSPWVTTSTASPAPPRVPTSLLPTPTWWATRRSSTPSWR